MGQSLQDQLLKSGAASQKQARKARQDVSQGKKKKKKHGKPDANAVEQQHIAAEAAAADARRREADRERARAANAERDARERRAAAEQLMTAQAVAREKPPADDPPYSFTMDGRIRRLPVSRAQRARLASGGLGIAHSAEQGYVLVERRVAERLAELVPERVCLAEPPAAPDPDDPYAGYEVPDDLMW